MSYTHYLLMQTAGLTEPSSWVYERQLVRTGRMHMICGGEVRGEGNLIAELNSGGHSRDLRGDTN